MDDRAAAIEVLRRARDLLAERLTDRILESRDEILGDALGLAYQSEIDAIYEQLGARLQHVSSMLANLPERKSPPETTRRDRPHAAKPAPVLAFPSLPAPTPVAGLLPAVGEASIFKTFVAQIQAGNVAGAGVTLAELFQLEPRRGLECAAAFNERVQLQPEIILKAIRLRSELAHGRTNRLLMLLWECFGLEGSESIDVLHTLQTRLAG